MNESDIENISHLDLYEILDISKDCSDSKIKKSYKKLVLRLHPDKPSGDQEAFELVNLSYTILRNSEYRKIYNLKRDDYLNSRDFKTLKYEKIEKPSSIPETKEQAKSNFKKLERELNKKHNFNLDDLNVINSSELKKRMDTLQFSRRNFDEDYKNNVKKKSLSKSDFNEMFINDSVVEENCSDIIAFNSSSSSITNFTPIDFNNLYDENGSSTKKYSSLDNAFTSMLPSKIQNKYNSHNYIDDTDREKYNKEMSKHLNSIRNIN